MSIIQPISIIKDNKDVLIKPFFHIVNSSFSKGDFPEIYKLAKVIPINKKFKFYKYK